ncbi:MAG: lysine transporter LysE [Desulfuromonas sp.]|nr:MAG: lysine transporter LysE [Desulfuromonas sp.]
MSSEFLVTSLIVVLVPGTGVIYTISTGLFLGWRASIAAAIGCTSGIIPHLLASTLGLAAILHVSALAFQTLKFVGVAYLLYLAWSMWRETGAIKFEDSSNGKSHRQIIARGFLINILNPKLSIFFLAFLPQFVPADSTTPMLQMFVLSTIFMVMTLFIFVGYGGFAHAVRSYVANSPRSILRVQRTFAVVFAALGAKLAMAER